MRRSGWVTGVTVIQLLVALTLAGGAIYLLVLTRSPEILNDKDEAEAAHGLRIAAAICAPLALIYLASVYGLWKDKLWGWWLGFLLNLAAAGTLVYSVIDDGWSHSDATDIALPVAFIVLLALFVIPAVRRHYWGPGNLRQEEVPIEGKQS
jgi:MFS family permease